MKQQLLEAWVTNNKINQMLVEQIAPEDMNKSFSAKARTIYQQLIHLNNVRLEWIRVTLPAFETNTLKLDKEKPFEKTKLVSAFEKSGKAIIELIDQSWEKQGKVKGYKKGLIPFICYLIAHESHHRGNILLTLKQNGGKISESLKWKIWDWNNL